jgi:4-hydroxy-3-polyprenylbenzoate decarboxylase
MHSLWGMGLMMLAKVIVVVDEDVDVENIQETWWVTLGNIDPERDVIFSKGPVDVLDHASQHFSYGSKMGIDATRKWKEEGFDRDWPEKIVMDPAVKEKVNNLWNQIYKKS